MTSKLSLMATAFCITSLHAADYEVKKELFEQSVRVQGIAAPQNAAEVVIAPEIWGDFIVEKVLPQGTKFEKGQQIVWIDTKKVDKYIQEQELERKIDGIRLQKAQQELAELKLKTQRDLLVAKRNYEREVENYKRYQEVDLPDQIASTKFDGEKSEWYLSYTREELRQLLKMYEADGLTEETEEIIVQRAQNSVKTLEIEIQFYLLAPLLCRLFMISSPWFRRASFVIAIFAIQYAATYLNTHFPSGLWSKSIIGQLQFFLVGLILGDLYLSYWKNTPRQKPFCYLLDCIGAATWLFIPFALKINGAHKWLALLLLLAFICVLRGSLLNWLLSRPLFATIGECVIQSISFTEPCSTFFMTT
ncbi:acyltransferase family protein [Rubritalea tangerina]|uniref:acyltransferase family protein n=1 Tax=Rubritalea tangerina TaxID=430798 RepID=UPI003610BF78